MPHCPLECIFNTLEACVLTLCPSRACIVTLVYHLSPLLVCIILEYIPWKQRSGCSMSATLLWTVSMKQEVIVRLGLSCRALYFFVRANASIRAAAPVVCELLVLSCCNDPFSSHPSHSLSNHRAHTLGLNNNLQEILITHTISYILTELILKIASYSHDIVHRLLLSPAACIHGVCTLK